MSEFVGGQPNTYQIDLAIHMARLLEVAARQALEEEYKATHDPLTGALNREGLSRFLETANIPKALLLVDNTNFKEVNLQYGYGEGDRVICDTYRLLQSSVRPTDVIVRWGGDEWLTVLNDDGQETNEASNLIEDRRVESVQVQHIEPVVNRLGQITEGYLIGRPDLRAINFNLAVGSAVWSGETDIEELVRQATDPMNAHKSEQHKLGKHRAA